MVQTPVDQRDDGKSSDSGFVVGRRKTDRKTVVWVAIIGMVLLVAYLFLTQGADLGQAELEAQRAKDQAGRMAEEYAASVDDPMGSSQQQLQDAQQALEAANNAKAKDAIDSMLPPPSEADNYNLDRLRRAADAINEGPKVEPRAAVDSNGFLVYSKDEEKKDGTPLVGDLATDATKEREAGQTEAAGPRPPLGQLSDEQIAAIKDPVLRAQMEKMKAAKEKQSNLENLMAQRATTIDSPGGEGNEAWVTRRRNDAVQTLTPTMAQRVVERYWLAPGTIVSAVLQQAVNTQIPAVVTARVTQNVYDSRYGGHLVIPAGSVLKGSYSTNIPASQKRAMVVFDTLITPSGGVVDLASMVASDQLGQAGVPGELHTHFWKRMGMATIFALEAVGLSRLEEPQPVILGSGQQQDTQGRVEGATILTSAFNNELDRRAGAGPYVTIEAGAQISLVLANGIAIPPIANTR